MKKINSFFLYFSFILVLEIIFKISCFKNIIDLNLLWIVIYNIPISIFLSFIISFFKEKLSSILTNIFIISTSIIFIAQIIYFDIYKSIFSVFSAKNGNQVLLFSDYILDVLLRNIISIMAILIISIIAIIFKKKLFNFNKETRKIKLILLGLFIVTYIVSLLMLNYNKNDINSNYELYNETSSSSIVTKRFGLINAMKIEIKKSIFKTSSKIVFKEIKKEDINPEIEYNKINIDFNKLIENENDEEIIKMHNYFKNQIPTNKNKYTGLLKGKNLVLILAESFDSIAIDKELTPTLYKLQKEGLNFTNFYTPLFPVSTSDGEYISRLSLLPKDGVWSMYKSSDNYLPFSIGNMLFNEGYKTNSYHNHSGKYYYRNLSHPNLGYNFKACGLNLSIDCTKWPESDLEMVEKSIDEYKNLKMPFLTYYITISGHLQYSKWNDMAIKNYEKVKNIKYSEKVKNYMSQHIELDKALEKLIKELKEAGKLEDTVIALGADHYPYGLTEKELNEKSNFNREDKFDLHKIPFIIWNEKIDHKDVDILSSNIDILPTLLNLFGLNYDSRLLIGKDIFSKHDNIVIFQDRSFITNKGKYDLYENKFLGDYVDDNYIKNIRKEISTKFEISKLVLEKDYYRKIIYK